MRYIGKVRSALLVIAFGLLFALSTPPFSQPWAPLLALTAFAIVLFQDLSVTRAAPKKRNAIRRGFGFGFLFGVGVNLAALRFVPGVIVRFTPLSFPVGVLALVLLSLAQGLAFGVLGGVTAALVRLGVKRPIALAGAMFASTYTPAVFPWTLTSGLTPWPICVQTADIWGDRGVTTFWTLVCGLVAVAALRFKTEQAPEERKGRRALLLAFAGIVLVLGYGGVRMQMFPLSDGTTRIGVVSQAVEARERWDVNAAGTIVTRLHELTRSTEREGAALTVWPEAAYPYGTPRGTTTDLYGERAILGPGIHGPVLTGIILRHSPGSMDAQDPGGTTNSAVLVTYDKLQGVGKFSEPQDKIHLLAFGEHVPFTSVFPQLRKVFFRGGKGLVPGNHNVLMQSGEVRAGVLNCFEDTLTDALRDAITDGGKQTAPGAPHRPANLLINITNDSWFKDSGESPLHEQMARLRAIEARRDLIRAVNYGPLSRIDAAGRVRERRYVNEPTYLVTTPTLREGTTAFVLAGDVPLTLAFSGLVIHAVLRTLREKRARNEAAATNGKTAES